MAAANADILVLMETQDRLALGSSYNAVDSEPRPKKAPPAPLIEEGCRCV